MGDLEWTEDIPPKPRECADVPMEWLSQHVPFQFQLIHGLSTSISIFNLLTHTLNQGYITEKLYNEVLNMPRHEKVRGFVYKVLPHFPDLAALYDALYRGVQESTLVNLRNYEIVMKEDYVKSKKTVKPPAKRKHQTTKMKFSAIKAQHGQSKCG